jgi:hypothetical protein
MILELDRFVLVEKAVDQLNLAVEDGLQSALGSVAEEPLKPAFISLKYVHYP